MRGVIRSVGTVAPIRRLSKDEKAAADWYTKLVDWWGFDPLDLMPGVGVAKSLVTPGVVGKAKKGAKVGKKLSKKAKELVGPSVDGVPMKRSRQGSVSPTEVTPFELQQLGLSKGAEPWDMGSKTTLGPATRPKRGKK